MHWRAHADHMTDFAAYDNGRCGRRRARRAGRAGRRGAGGRGRGGADGARPRPGVRQGRRPQLAAAGRPRADQGAGLPPAGRCEPQAFLGTLLAEADGNPRPVDGREDATTALSVVPPGRGCGGCGCTTYAPLATPCECCRHSRPLGRRARHDGRTRPDRARVWAHHGVFEHERANGQPFIIDVVARRRHRRPRRPRTTCQTTVDYGSLAVVGESRRREGSGRPDRDPRPADRGGLPLGRPC